MNIPFEVTIIMVHILKYTFTFLIIFVITKNYWTNNLRQVILVVYWVFGKYDVICVVCSVYF